ncbi:MAG: PrsW family intramembrane metalloprotease [Oscillospiraceae bacterium]|nr:PrsW family intramembrane metalloprotease [Oscillospiraceae bacterium]
MIYAENILLCVAVPLILSLLFVRGEVRRYVAAFLLGMGMCLCAAYIGGFLNLVTGMGENDTAIFLSPIVEELMKLMPLLLFLVIFAPDYRTLTMLAVAIGAGFATFENCCYILTSGAESLTYVLIRGLAVGVMHIDSILALSIWFIAAKRLRVFSFPTVVGGLSLAMIFHALYNLLVSGHGATRVVGYLLPLLAAAGLYSLFRKLPHLWK